MSINKTNHQNSQNQEMNENINNLIIKDYISQNESLKSHISDLESQIRELKSHITELGNRNLALIEYEQENVSLNTETKQLKQTITDLEQEIISTLKKGKEEAREVATELENEVSYYKRIADSVKGKIEAAEYIIHLNSIQHNYILKLEKELENIKLNNKMHINEIKVEHDLHYKHLKHKMIDIIKKSNKEIQKENITNIEIHSKFSAINKGEILDELEKQNIQIIQLIRENEEKDKQILNLTQEKQSYYSVNKLLKKKNLKLSKLIGNFIEKQEQMNLQRVYPRIHIIFLCTSTYFVSNSTDFIGISLISYHVDLYFFMYDSVIFYICIWRQRYFRILITRKTHDKLS